MFFCMKKTTLIIPDRIFRELKRCATERGRTISSLATEFLRKGLAEPEQSGELPPLPVFEGTGPPLVDVADCDALYGNTA